MMLIIILLFIAVVIILGLLYIIFSLKVSLKTVKEKAETNNKAKSVFLANMSHEIRTPLNAILGITEMQLQNETIHGEMSETLLQIFENGNLLMNIVNDFLDLTAMEAGLFKLKPAKYDIPSLINDTVQLNRLRYENKPVDFSLEIDKDTPVNLIGDSLRIKQILNNILTNAYKYTDKDNVSAIKMSPISKIEMSVSSKFNGTEENGQIIFRIKDTGRGMSKDEINKLYDDYSGTGLGMTVIKRLVDLMNGEIQAESKLGKGSLFTVIIPQKRIDLTVCGYELAKKLANFKFKGTRFHKRTHIIPEYMPYGSVLIVDDVESNIYVTKGILLPYGIKVESASSGFEAIDIIKEGNEFDIIFMDHMMPKMDGLETVKHIRALGYKKPIVALTVNTLAGQANMFLENGFDGYLSKPIDTRELNLLLNDLIRNKQPPEILQAVQALEEDRRKKSQILHNFS